MFMATLIMERLISLLYGPQYKDSKVKYIYK